MAIHITVLDVPVKWRNRPGRGRLAEQRIPAKTVRNLCCQPPLDNAAQTAQQNRVALLRPDRCWYECCQVCCCLWNARSQDFPSSQYYYSYCCLTNSPKRSKTTHGWGKTWARGRGLHGATDRQTAKREW